jgi:hypothetical protein
MAHHWEHKDPKTCKELETLLKETSAQDFNKQGKLHENTRD